MAIASAKELRLALRKAMPPEAFSAQPMRGVRSLCMSAFALALACVIVLTAMPWYVDLVLGMIVGERMAAGLLCAHESMHGAVFKSRFWRAVMDWVGLVPLLVTPGLWRAWHNNAHHKSANNIEFDPDALGTVEQYESSFPMRVRTMMSPGSGHWSSYAGFFCLFTLEGQFFLWKASGTEPMKGKTKDRTQLRCSSSILFGAWFGLVYIIGFPDAIFAMIVPLAIANLILMSYISTQHWNRPQVHQDDPFCTAMSIHLPKWVDWLHYEFSYHQEHHIFPSLSGKYAPLLREKLLEIEPRAVAVMPFGKAIRERLRSPVLYADDYSLVDMDGERHVDLHEMAQRLNLPTRFDEGANQSKESNVVPPPMSKMGKGKKQGKTV